MVSCIGAADAQNERTPTPTPTPTPSMGHSDAAAEEDSGKIEVPSTAAPEEAETSFVCAEDIATATKEVKEESANAEYKDVSNAEESHCAGAMAVKEAEKRLSRLQKNSEEYLDFGPKPAG